MNKNEFMELLRREAPGKLANDYLLSTSVAAFADPNEYTNFRNNVAVTFGSVEAVAIAGSGNWRFSTNPEKAFKEFHAGSDIDLAVISRKHFYELWEAMRYLHRTSWYRLGHLERQDLRRNGENVYCGFVSPFWLPQLHAPLRLKYKRLLNRLSDSSVGYRSVKVFFFKNITEAVSYYERGFSQARRSIK